MCLKILELGIKRDLFDELVKHLDVRSTIGIIGLRRTGKTVLLKQIIDHLISEKVERDRILYFSFDEENMSIEEVINEYLSRTGKDISGTDRIYIFFDEIQKLDGWQNQLKYYYDTFHKIKFFVSGSSSLFMKTFSAEKGLVVTMDREGEELVNGMRIEFVPLWKWLL